MVKVKVKNERDELCLGDYYYSLDETSFFSFPRTGRTLSTLRRTFVSSSRSGQNPLILLDLSSYGPYVKYQERERRKVVQVLIITYSEKLM